MSVDRREVLRGLAASLAIGLPLGPAFAESPVSRVLPAPDFDRLRRHDPYVVGVRPFRKGGVRLEEGPPLGATRVLHNYGHAGAGITLSFGCAEALADLADPILGPLDDTASIAVLGTGVIGLTTAAALRRRHPKIPLTVYARSLDLKQTTSAVAGGQFEPSGVWRQMREGDDRKRLEDWLRRSRDFIVNASGQWERYGIATRDNYTLETGASGFDEGSPRDVVEAPETLALPFEKLTAPGRRYKTWLVNPVYLLPALRADLERDGVAFVERSFDTPADVAAIGASVVVNCTGYGAKALFDDPAVIAQRGHLVMLERTSEAQDWFFGGGCANRVTCYVFCRQDDIVVGGTVIGGDDRAAVLDEDSAVFERLLGNARQVFGGFPHRCER